MSMLLIKKKLVLGRTLNMPFFNFSSSFSKPKKSLTKNYGKTRVRKT